MIEFIYSIINILITPFLLVNLAYRCSVSKEDYARVKERFGLATANRPYGKLVWIHAASVGESMSVSNLVEKLHAEGCNILFTTYTRASADVVKKKYHNKLIHQYLPVENFFAINLFLNFWKPSIAVFVESEFWPIITYSASKRSKLISLSTKVSDRSFYRWKKVKPFISDVLNKFEIFYPQNNQAKERLSYMGVRNIGFVGNVKYSSKALSVNKKNRNELETQLDGRPAILAFSTHEGEEVELLQVYKNLLSHKKNLLLVIAPRHLKRSSEIKSLIVSENLNFAERSKNVKISKDTNIYLADTMGELGTFFDIIKINIIGGSINKDIGGHNPIEPAMLKSMCLMGPQNHGFKEITEDFVANNAMVRFQDNKSLEIEVLKLLNDTELVKKYSLNAYDLVKRQSKLYDALFKKVVEDLK